jgi:hypothetical protein
LSDKSDGYRVFADQVVTTGGNFKKTAIEYKNLMPISGFNPPDTGNAEVNATLETVLRAIGELHLMISQAAYQHGAKLLLAGESYSETEDANARLQRAVLEIAPNVKFPIPPSP